MKTKKVKCYGWAIISKGKLLRGEMFNIFDLKITAMEHTRPWDKVVKVKIVEC